MGNTTGIARYDYGNQAWTVDGRYERCGHTVPCRCYASMHAGDPVPDRVRAEWALQDSQTDTAIRPALH